MQNIPIPRKVKIGGFDYTVVADGKADRELSGLNWVGSESLNDQRIQIHTNQSPQGTSNTFLHEITHAINRIYNNGKLCEEDVNQVANGLHQVMEQLGIRFVR